MNNAEKLFNDLKQWIDDALAHRYDPRVPQEFPTISGAETALKITDSEKKNTLKPDAPFRLKRFKKQVFRLPQTRFLLSVFQAEAISVFWLEIYQYHIILIKNYHSAPVVFQLQTLKKIPFTGTVQIEKNGKFLVSGQTVLWDLPFSADQLLPALHQYRDAAYRHHPIHQITFPVYDYLRALDDLWAELPYFDEEGNVFTPQVLKQSVAGVLLIQELLFALGRMDALRVFYEQIFAQFWPQLSQTKQQVVYRCYQRFVRVNGEPLKITINTPPDGKVKSEFFDLLCQKDDYENSEEIYEQIQKFWEKFSLPIFNSIFTRNVRQNPIHWLSFYFLAVNYKFHWQEQLYSKIEPLLSDRKFRLLFRVIHLLQQNVIFLQEKEKWTFASIYRRSNINALRLVQPKLEFKQVQLRNRTLCHLKLQDEGDFVIDRAVEIELLHNQKQLLIHPMKTRPPVSVMPYRKVRVSVFDWTMEIPLIWEKFYVEFNQTRIRFLLKKKRFQLSIKLPKSMPEVRIDGKKLSDKNGRYQKVYLPVDRKPGMWRIELCDRLGRRKKTICPNDKLIFIHGAAKDINGIFRYDLRGLFNESKRSTSVKTDWPEVSAVPLPHPVQRLRLTIRKSQPYLLETVGGNAFIHKLIFTPSELLAIKLKIVTDNDPGEIRRYFGRYWGIYSEIHLSKDAPVRPGEFLFYVTKDVPGEVESTFSLCSIIKRDDKTELPVLWIPPGKLRIFLENIWQVQ